MGERHRAEPISNIDNNLKTLRAAKGMSQGELAESAKITRQAVCAIEGNHYLPTTAVALRLAGVLGCRVEDLFSLRATGEIIHGEFIDETEQADTTMISTRVKVARVGNRYVVRPVRALGELLAYTVPADGLLVGGEGDTRPRSRPSNRVRVQLLRDRRVIEQEISIAGCDPAVFLAGEYLRRYKETATVTGWMMGSGAAVEALKRREVHMAGLHIKDEKTGESNLPYLRSHLKGDDYLIVTFAAWEEGLIVGRGNPKTIRSIEDLGRPDVTLINREKGAGARQLLDQRLDQEGLLKEDVRGYNLMADSHFQVARRIAEGQADVGIGVRSAANLFALSFIPLQQSRYDLVVPKSYLSVIPSIGNLFDAIVSRQFRTEIEALGGYDTTETGKIRQLRRQ
ncbi:MAG TPA: substrate-binding domain-containing protein [Nitrospira sp.]|nr:substrate-binding domain-containing protein [Nitrospira sp.]